MKRNNKKPFFSEEKKGDGESKSFESRNSSRRASGYHKSQGDEYGDRPKAGKRFAEKKTEESKSLGERKFGSKFNPDKGKSVESRNSGYVGHEDSGERGINKSEGHGGGRKSFPKGERDNPSKKKHGGGADYKKYSEGGSRSAPTRKEEGSYKSSSRYPKDEEPKGPMVYRGRGRDQKPIFEQAKPGFSEQKKEVRGFGKKRFQGRNQEENPERPDYNFDELPSKKVKLSPEDTTIRLNKYIANSGICSRREADELITKGLVTVNGELCTEMGRKVKKSDRVVYQGKKINPEKPVYVLLNKPKDFITTTDDPMDRKTVMNLVGNACEERIFPVGRLDRNTTGLLLFTNDGELAAKLSHPSNQIKKIYQVTLDKPITYKDEEAIREGLTLEDGPAKVDDIQVLSLDRKILGLEIHIGRNRIVRRIFAHLGYDVTALDRVVYAGLDKKDLKRGNYRFLSEQEVIRLKFFV